MAFIKITHKSKNKVTLQSDMFDNIREHFSVEKDSFFGGRKKSFFGVKPREYMITPLGTFDIGLIKDVVKFALSQGIPVSVEIDERVKQILKPKLIFEKGEALQFDQFELRPYQKESVELAINQGRGVIILPTATGKTLTMASLIKTILSENPMHGKYVLVLVPDIGLVSQTYDDFIKYGLDYKICKWSGNNDFDPEAKIVICNQAIIRSESKMKIANHLAKNTGLLIIDEVHTIKKGNKVTKIVDTFDSSFRFGFTGTLPDNLTDQWTVYGKVGPLIKEEEAHEMRSEKYIAEVISKIIVIHHKDPPKIKINIEEPTKAYNEEILWLATNEFRNKLISNIALKLKFNSLLLVNRLDHGKALLEIAKSLNIDNKEIHFIEGEVEVEDREKVKKMMEEKDNVICIAMSSIFSTGISINNLHYIFFCAGGKSRVRIIQSIGRGSRLHKSKEKMVIFDIADNTRYSLKHLNKRITLYKEQKIPYEKTIITQA
jgi:superfamily II DNA or RNA helicase